MSARGGWSVEGRPVAAGGGGGGRWRRLEHGGSLVMEAAAAGVCVCVCVCV